MLHTSLTLYDFQKFEEGYYATDFHGSSLIIPEDVDPYAWYCLTLNIRELDDATAVENNIQQGDILMQFLSNFSVHFCRGFNLDDLAWVWTKLRERVSRDKICPELLPSRPPSTRQCSLCLHQGLHTFQW